MAEIRDRVNDVEWPAHAGQHSGTAGPARISVRPARPGDAATLAPRLRPADLREIEAAVGRDPLAVLRQGIARSEPSLAIVDQADRPVALFGVVPDPATEQVGQVWLLASDELARHSLSFLRQSGEWVDRLHRRYRTLWNHVDARNELHMRWLEWCGFSRVGLIQEFGVQKRPFYEFERADGRAGR